MLSTNMLGEKGIIISNIIGTMGKKLEHFHSFNDDYFNKCQCRMFLNADQWLNPDYFGDPVVFSHHDVHIFGF